MSREVRAALIVSTIIAAIVVGCSAQVSPGPAPSPTAQIVTSPAPSPTAQIVTSPTPSPTTSPSGAAQYAGTWLNDDPNTRDIPQLIISNVGQTLSIHGYGACTPTYCDWGTVSGQFNGDPFIITFVFDGSRPDACCTGAPTVQLTITFDPADPTKLMVVSTSAAAGTITNIMHRAA